MNLDQINSGANQERQSRVIKCMIHESRNREFSAKGHCLQDQDMRTIWIFNENCSTATRQLELCTHGIGQ